MNRDNPDKAAIFFYTQFDDLNFWSNYGIVDIKGDPAGGKYIVIVEPVRQTLEIRRKGYKTEMIRLESMQPNDVLFYDVLPKKNSGSVDFSEIGVTIQADPPEATIKIDGINVENDKSKPLTIGKHRLDVSHDGYVTISREIDVSPTNNLFKIKLEKIELAQVYISTAPEGAEIRINNELKGISNKGLFLYPGEYQLHLSKEDHLSLERKLVVTGDKRKDKFHFPLTLNKGFLKLEIEPEGSVLKIDGESVDMQQQFELSPGVHSIAILQNLCFPYTENIKIELGKTVTRRIILEKNAGRLVITTDPPDATIILNREEEIGKEVELSPGRYEITVKSEDYKPAIFSVSLKNGDIIRKRIHLLPEVGSLKLSVFPPEAECTLSKGDKEISRWKGMKYFSSLPVGRYTIKLTYKKESDQEDIYIYADQTTEKEFRLNSDQVFTATIDDKEPEAAYEEVNKQPKEEVFTFVEEFPSYPGGDGALYGFLAQNIQYPEIAKRAGVEGQVIVTFTVSKTGQISAPRVARGIGGGCDEEALRVLMMMPRWNPGKQNGQPVNVQVTVPIRFQLPEEGQDS